MYLYKSETSSIQIQILHNLYIYQVYRRVFVYRTLLSSRPLHSDMLNYIIIIMTAYELRP